MSCFVSALILSCSNLSVAGGSGSEVRTLYGSLITPDGKPAQNTQVTLVSSDYDPASGKPIPDSLLDTTDKNGRYSLKVPAPGLYNIQAVDNSNIMRVLIAGVMVQGESTEAVQGILENPGAVKVVIPDGLDTNYGYLYIPGTTVYSLLSKISGGSVVLDSVPASVHLAVYYAVKGSSAQPQLVRDSIVVVPGSVTTIQYVGWKFSKKLRLNTTAAGANVAGNVTDFPVLIRLNGSNFNFSQARPDGADIRFTKADNTPVPYEIERWDATLRSAEIWVKLDTVFGNDSSHLITMYWGASTVGSTGSPQGSATASLSNSAAVFDTANGFQGVWHMNEPNGLVAQDATGNHYDGTPSDTAPAAAEGAIGLAQEFDGVSNYLQMIGTSASKLNFPENGNYSLSAWVYVDTLVDSTTHVIASKGHEQYYLKLYWDIQHWEFAEYHDKVGWQVSSYAPAVARVWKFLVGVRDGNNQYLYLDGQLVTSGYGLAGDTSVARNTADDFSIGKYLRYAAYTGQGYSWFDGKIDEVRISSRSLGADWIKLCYMNQKDPDVLLKW